MIKHMFSPIQIGPMTVKNRFVVPPMGNNFANTDGTLSEQSLAYYVERAKGEFGLITIEATVVHNGAKGGPRKPCLFDDSVIPSFKKVADACHEYGAKVSVQLQNAGPDGHAEFAGAPIVAASPIANRCGKDIPLELSTERVYELIEGYGEAARRAMEAGIDAVEIHMAHGYLVSSFISPRTNKRVDEFGGSFQNRMRFPRLIIEKVRSVVGNKVAILARINASDEMPGGIDIHDSATVASYLEEVGLDAINVSRAVHIKDEYMWAPTQTHAGFSADYITEIKKAVSIPVITVGRYTDPFFAELMVKQNRTDLVAFGRQSIADPSMPRLAKEGKLEETIPCIACLQGCVANMFKGLPIRCLTNPYLGHEEMGITEATEKKRIMVIGGGVAGLSFAFMSAKRGHDVTVYEATSTLGGNMRLAAFPPGKGDITNMVRSYIVLCEKYGVKVELNTEVTEELIKEVNPDAVIVATGAKPLILPIEGIDNEAILSGSDILEGKVRAGNRVLIVGGGMVGSETAAFLAERDHKVDIIEYRDACGVDVIKEHRVYLMEDFEKYNIGQITGAKVVKFNADGVEYETCQGENNTISNYDSVVLSMGFKNYNPFDKMLENSNYEYHVIGDAVRARRALDATQEAYEIAATI